MSRERGSTYHNYHLVKKPADTRVGEDEARDLRMFRRQHDLPEESHTWQLQAVDETTTTNWYIVHAVGGEPSHVYDVDPRVWREAWRAAHHTPIDESRYPYSFNDQTTEDLDTYRQFQILWWVKGNDVTPRKFRSQQARQRYQRRAAPRKGYQDLMSPDA